MLRFLIRLLFQVQTSTSYSRTESSSSAASQSYETLTKSATTATVPVRDSERIPGGGRLERSERVVLQPSISSIGGAVLRSKTADIERMLSKKGSTTTERRRYDSSSSAAPSGSSGSATTRSIWKRHELISSQPKERRSFF